MKSVYYSTMLLFVAGLISTEAIAQFRQHNIWLQWEDFTRQYYLTQDPNTGIWHKTNAWIDVTLELDGDIWTATVTNLRSDKKLVSLTHPWDQGYDYTQYDPDPNVRHEPIANFEYVAGSDPNDDFVIVPYWMGCAFENTKLASGIAGGPFIGYPGAVVPLLIQADANHARITASANWPPTDVRMSWKRGRQALIHDDLDPNDPNDSLLGLNEVYAFQYIRSEVTSDGTTPAWLVAADKYKTWLRQYVSRDPNAIVTVSEPQWMRATHGLFNYQLEARPVSSLEQIPEIWRLYKRTFPWIQFWGQMPDDPLTEGVDCCALNPTLNPRFDRNDPNMEWDLLTFVEGVTDPNDPNDYRAGYYVRPYPGYKLIPSEYIPEEAIGNRGWVANWVNISKSSWGANAVYNDTLAAKNFGPAIDIANMLANDPNYDDTIAEGAQDVYPIPFFVSGSSHYRVDSGVFFQGGEATSTDDLIADPNLTAVSFAELGAYILSDRLFFNGGSNSAYEVSGWSANYWLVRESFLFGFRYETGHPFDSGGPNGWQITKWHPALKCVIDLRDQVGWLSIGAEYDDVKTILSMTNLEARHHVTPTMHYYCIDAWGCDDGVLAVQDPTDPNDPNGITISIPAEVDLAIATVDGITGAVTLYTSNDCHQVDQVTNYGATTATEAYPADPNDPNSARFLNSVRQTCPGAFLMSDTALMDHVVTPVDTFGADTATKYEVYALRWIGAEEDSLSGIDLWTTADCFIYATDPNYSINDPSYLDLVFEGVRPVEREGNKLLHLPTQCADVYEYRVDLVCDSIELLPGKQYYIGARLVTDGNGIGVAGVWHSGVTDDPNQPAMLRIGDSSHGWTPLTNYAFIPSAETTGYSFRLDGALR